VIFARSLVVVAVGTSLACTHAPLRAGTTPDTQVITEDEIADSHSSNAYEVIHKLRANFLSNRGETSFYRNQSNPYPTVYLDDLEYGPISILSSIPASQLSTIRLYRVSEANAKYGTHNLSGVIAITTKQ
jgi:hypothetical protein